MNSILEALPVELVCHIAAFLDLSDIRCLRLTSRTLVSVLAPRHLPHFFDSKSVELTLEDLRSMVYMTSQGRAGCLLKHCTIIGVAVSDISLAPDFFELVRLLTEAFINLQKYSPRAGLASLHLSVAARPQLITFLDGIHDYVHPSRRDVWDAALRTFNITMEALRGSQFPLVGHLDLFSGVLECGLVYKAFLPLDQKLESIRIFNSLKKLTMKLSSPSILQTEESFGHGLRGVPLLQGILEMSVFMPELEDMDIHWYNIGGDHLTMLGDHTIRVDTSSYVNPARLKTCRLRGLFVVESDLLDYIKAFQPTALTISDTRLVSGAWTSIFDYLTSVDSLVTSYHLDDIREGYDLVHFDAPGEPKFPYRDITVGPSTLTRQKDDAKKAIRYSTISWRRMIISDAMARWLKNKIIEFGPPNADFPT
ncbi:hypothetical protein F4825DRAFT_406062 [Nemania diffusa]|nr:hypothetical protein F4825DRAFT_406062 [Nemania diffusa]